MRQIIGLLTIIILTVQAQLVWGIKHMSDTLCKSNDYQCTIVAAGDTWESLFPNPEHRDIVKRVNRMNIPLKQNMTIAVPKNIEKLTVYDVSPFPRYIEAAGEKMIFISQKELAWGAYDEKGELVWWGPLSSGSGNCSEKLAGCKTPTGSFRVIRKGDIDCISTAFPIRPDGVSGGAAMPFCMHFWRGYALHGSYAVPGYRDSHGCIRIFIEDAEWLSQEFVDAPGEGVNKGTRVVVDDLEVEKKG